MSMKLLYDGFHKIEAVEAVIKGKEVMREKLLLPSAVSALVTDQDGDMLFVKQYRPTLGIHTLEIPAGVKDKPHLTSYGTLLEELQEECGIYDFDIDFSNHSYDPVLKYFMVTGSSDATMEIYRIRCSSREKLLKVPDNDVEEAIYLSHETIRSMYEDGEFIDPKTIIAVQLYLTEE